MQILKILGAAFDENYLTNTKEGYAYYEIGDTELAYSLCAKFNYSHSAGGRCDILISLTDFEVDGFRFYNDDYADEQVTWLCDTDEEITLSEADKGIYRMLCQELGCRAIAQN